MKPLSRKRQVAKASHDSMYPKELSRPDNWWDVLHKESYMMFPEKDLWRQRLIFTMHKYFDDPSKLELEEFCIDYKLSVFTLRGLRRQYPDIAKAADEIKAKIGVRRRVGVMKNQLNGQACYKDMHTLDPEWSSVDKYWSDLKKAEEQATRDFTILMKPADKPKDKE